MYICFKDKIAQNGLIDQFQTMCFFVKIDLHDLSFQMSSHTTRWDKIDFFSDDLYSPGDFVGSLQCSA